MCPRTRCDVMKLVHYVIICVSFLKHCVLFLRGLIADKPDDSLFFVDVGEPKKKECLPEGKKCDDSVLLYRIHFINNIRGGAF